MNRNDCGGVYFHVLFCCLQDLIDFWSEISSIFFVDLFLFSLQFKTRWCAERHFTHDFLQGHVKAPRTINKMIYALCACTRKQQVDLLAIHRRRPLRLRTLYECCWRQVVTATDGVA